MGIAPLLRAACQKKASQSFASADAKAVLYVFCRDMCVAENTLRGVSVELSAISGQQRRRTQRSFLEKAAKPLFRQSKNTTGEHFPVVFSAPAQPTGMPSALVTAWQRCMSVSTSSIEMLRVIFSVRS